MPVVSKTLGVFDTIAISERVDYTKSYNTLFFSLFRRKVPIRYLTLPVADKFDISDYASAKKIIIVAAGDYALITDSASARGATVILALDYGLLTDTASLTNRAVTVYDVIPIIDYGTAVRAILLEAKDYMLAGDYIDVKKVSAITASDVLLADSISTAKSYSPLLFAVLRRRVPIVYKTLGILDTAIIKDTASAVLIKKVSVGDSLLADSYSIRNLAVHASDIATVADYGTAVKAKVLDVLDYISAADNVYSNRAVVITALERLVADGTSYAKSYSPLFFTLLRRRVPVVYKTLGVLDMVAVRDGLSVAVIKKTSASDYVVSDHAGIKRVGVSAVDYIISDSATTAQVKKVLASDYVVRDSASYVKSYSPLFFLSLQVAISVRYLTLDVTDVLVVSDSAVSEVKKTVSVSDYVVYDYVPSMSPSGVKYRSLYANVGMRTISVFDKVVPYESVWVGPRVITVNARDYLVSDGVAVIKRSVHAYDVVVVWENVNIVRL